MKRFFAPRSIAVVGASSNPAAIGGKPITQLLTHGYEGTIHPVNPKREEVQGLLCVASVDDLPTGIDLAIVAVAAHLVPGIIEACGRRKIPYAVVLSSGFADAGGEGLERQVELAETARLAGVRVLGPNCVGFISMATGVYAGFGAFFDYNFEPGSVGFVTQSGGVGGSLLTIADEQGVRFGHFIHTGNAVDLDIEAIIEASIDAPAINTVVAYIEGLGESGSFARVAGRALEADVPLVIWKAGRTEGAASAVVSHTGRMAGDMERYRAVFDRFGVIEVDDTADLIDVLRLAQSGQRAKGGRVGVVSVSGGAGVVAADVLHDASELELATFSDEAVAQIADQLPAFASAANPIDVTAQIFNEPDLFERVVRVLAQHDSVDQVLACVASVHSQVGEEIARAIVDASEHLGVPIVVAWSARMSVNAKAFRMLAEAGIPVFHSPERALKAMDRLARFTRARRDHAVAGNAPTSVGTGDRDWSRTVEYDVLQELAAAGVAVPTQVLAASPEQAASAAEAHGYPVVVKIQSADIPHKADVGGVRLGLTDSSQVREATREVLEIANEMPDVEHRGVLVQSMVASGTELILGYIRDRSLGGFLLFGRGGSGVEQMGDRVLVAAPASADCIVDRLRTLRIVAEHGLDDVALQAVAEVGLALQRIVSEASPELEEIEINPIIVHGSTVTAVDALAVQPSTVLSA